jgi:hypothetical protein
MDAGRQARLSHMTSSHYMHLLTYLVERHALEVEEAHRAQAVRVPRLGDVAPNLGRWQGVQRRRFATSAQPSTAGVLLHHCNSDPGLQL